MGAARGASGAGSVSGGGTAARTGAGAGAGGVERALLLDGPAVVACAATDWRTLAASAGLSIGVLGVVRAGGTPFAAGAVNMASMVGRSAAPNGVERKSLGSAATLSAPTFDENNEKGLTCNVGREAAARQESKTVIGERVTVKVCARTCSVLAHAGEAANDRSPSR